MSSMIVYHPNESCFAVENEWRRELDFAMQNGQRFFLLLFETANFSISFVSWCCSFFVCLWRLEIVELSQRIQLFYTLRTIDCICKEVIFFDISHTSAHTAKQIAQQFMPKKRNINNSEWNGERFLRCSTDCVENLSIDNQMDGINNG